MSRPAGVTGKVSPYPTVVTVVTAHQSASPNESMLPPLSCSTASASAAAPQDEQRGEQHDVVEVAADQEAPPLPADDACCRDDAQESKDPQGSEERHDDDDEVRPVVANESPSAVRRQVEADGVVECEGCPDGYVEGDECGVDGGR
jgi:hypothetical protein